MPDTDDENKNNLMFPNFKQLGLSIMKKKIQNSTDNFNITVPWK